MKAEITFNQMYWNSSLTNFFFRSQSQDTITDLMERAKHGTQSVVDAIDGYCDSEDIDADELDELFYSYGTETLAEMFGIELEEEEEEEEEED